MKCSGAPCEGILADETSEAKKRRRPFFAFDADGWPATVELLEASGKVWPVAAQVADLRWHANQRWLTRNLSGDLRHVTPSEHDLHVSWGISRNRVRALIADVETWVDPVAPWASAGVGALRAHRTNKRDKAGTNAGQPQDDAGTTKHGRTWKVKKVWDDAGTMLGRTRDDAGTPFRDKNHPTIEPLNQEPEVEPASGPAVQGSLLPLASPSADVVNKPKAIPDEVATAHAAFRVSSGLTRKMTLDPKKGDGRIIAALVKSLGAEQVAAVYDWLATSAHQEALFYRGQAPRAAGGFYAPRDAKWLTGHLDGVLDAMDRKAAPDTSAPSGHALAPADEWERCAQATGYHPVNWLHKVHPDRRERMAAASKAAGGVTGLGRCTHPIETRNMKEAFNKAYGAT